MTAEEIENRKKLAKLLHEAGEIAKNVESRGWEVPSMYISEQCLHWAEQYGYRGKVEKA